MAISRYRRIAMFVMTGAVVAELCSCGGESDDRGENLRLPANAIARVGDALLLKGDFDQIMRVANAAVSAGSGQPVDLAHVSARECAELKRKFLGEDGRYREEPGAKEWLKGCRHQYRQAKKYAVSFLIEAASLAQEAERRGISVSKAEVVRAVRAQDKSQIGIAALPRTRDVTAIMNSQARVLLLRQKLHEVVARPRQEAPITEEQVKRYYDRSGSEFIPPQVRRLHMIAARGRTQAMAAKKALEDGVAWPKVAKRFPFARKAAGDLVAPDGRVQLVPRMVWGPLDRAVFEASPGTVEGPIATDAGWWVFEVDNVLTQSKRPLAAVKQAVRQRIAQQRATRAVEEFTEDFTSRYRAKTVCRRGYVVDTCSERASA